MCVLAGGRRPTSGLPNLLEPHERTRGLLPSDLDEGMIAICCTLIQLWKSRMCYPEQKLHGRWLSSRATCSRIVRTAASSTPK